MKSPHTATNSCENPRAYNCKTMDRATSKHVIDACLMVIIFHALKMCGGKLLYKHRHTDQPTLQQVLYL